MAGAADLRVYRRRIKSVQSTKKITRAMELIAASRIAKARRAVQAARPYSAGMNRVVRHLSSFTQAKNHPVMRSHKGKANTCVVVITSDRGLAGAYNINAIRTAYDLMQEFKAKGDTVQVVCIGYKGATWLRFRNVPVARVYEGISDQPTPEAARRVVNPIVEDFRTGAIDRVVVVYTDFVNALVQQTRHAQILPIDIDKPIDISLDDSAQAEHTGELQPEYVIDPGLDTMLDALLPRYVQQQLFAAMLESAASEHASRQRAMKAATENAEEVINTLTIKANTARQAAVTSEISEIVGGADALARSSH